MTRIFLIRHGENIDGQIDGQGPIVDLGLSEMGRIQVDRLCARLGADEGLQATVLLASPERRAAETAQALSVALGLQVVTDARLEEWRSDDGSLPQAEFVAQWRALREPDRAYHRFQPNAESQAEFFARVGEALHHISRAHAGKDTLVVTHGGFIQASFRHFFGFGDAAFRRAYPVAAHTSLTLWREEVSNGRWALDCSNDVSHLERAAIEDRSDIRTKLIAATPADVFSALQDPDRVARWWGPAGFTNTIETYEFTPGGRWLLTMHGPDGKDYPNESRFTRIVPNRLFEIEHLGGHHFTLTLELSLHAQGTNVHWRQTFDTVQHYQGLATFVAAANEQNLERLAEEVMRARGDVT